MTTNPSLHHSSTTSEPITEVNSQQAIVCLPSSLLLVWSLSLICLSTVILLLSVPPSHGYESSIYTAVPWFTWAALVAGALLGAGSAIWAASNPSLHQTRAWLVGIGLVIASSTIVVLIPLLRGYAGYPRADLMTHAGRIIDIAQVGSLPQYEEPGLNVIYPAPIIVLSQLAFITGLKPFTLVQLVTVVTFLLKILLIYLVGKTIFSHPLPITLTTLAGSVLLEQSTWYDVWPSTFGTILTLLPIWLYFRSITTQSIGYRFLLILMALVIPFVHPIALITFFICFLMLALYNFGAESLAIEARRIRFRPKFSSQLFAGTILISFITFVTWLTYNAYFWNVSVRHLYNIVTSIGGGSYAWTIEEANKVQMTPLQFWFLLFKMHGHHLWYLSLSAIGCLLILKTALTDRGNSTIQQLLAVVFILIGLIIFLLVNLFGGSSISGYWRVLLALMLHVPVVLAYLGERTFQILGRHKSRHTLSTLKQVFAVGIPLSAFALAYVVGLFNYHPAPHAFRLNQQISPQEFQGMNWFIAHRDEAITIDSFSTTPKILFGQSSDGVQKAVRLYSTGLYWRESEAPEHFDYAQERLAEETFDTYYLPIHPYDQLFHTMIPRNPVRWGQSDFEQLEHTPYMDKVYVNGESVLWVVYPEEAQAK